MSNQPATNNEERQYRYLVECGRYTTMSETYHKRGPLNINLHVPGVPHIIFCPERHTYEKVIDVQPLPTKKEAEAFLNRNRRKSRYYNNQTDEAATN